MENPIKEEAILDRDTVMKEPKGLSEHKRLNARAKALLYLSSAKI